ncbi:MAG: IS5 family transposase [Acidobacteriota bacterium]|nr:IS5 family transposase [Acidobacteriota bacterium]
MRGDDKQQLGAFSYVSLEERVPSEHPLRIVRKLVDEIFRTMSKQFDSLYSATGRPSIPPERLLRALLLQILYSVRSERMLMEQMDYNLLFRWFVGVEMDEPVWNHAVFSKNRDRLLNQEVARVFFDRVLSQAKAHLSDEHFTVDGTLVEAWASQKSFQKKDSDEDAGGEFRGQKRSNDTHQSKTDPEAKLYRKGHGQEAKLSYLGHVLIENRNGIIVDAMLTQADGTAERDAAMILTHRQCKRNRKRGRYGPITVGADKAYDTRDFVSILRDMNVRPHVAQNVRRPGGSAIDQRTTRHVGYGLSQHKRPLVEKAFGWMKQTGGMRKTKLRGLWKVGWQFLMTAAAFNLWRLPKLNASPGITNLATT